MCSLLFIEFNVIMQRTADLVLGVLLLSTSTTLEHLLQGLRVAENTDNSSVWLTSAPDFVIIIILVWIHQYCQHFLS